MASPVPASGDFSDLVDLSRTKIKLPIHDEDISDNLELVKLAGNKSARQTWQHRAAGFQKN